VSEPALDSRSRTWAWAIVCLLTASASVAFVVGDLARPGLYYDEVIQAEPAVQFLAADGTPSAVPGARTIRAFGGWFPVFIQPYMGALKSQVLIPVFAVFAPSAASLRIATLAIAAIGVLFAALWVRRILGAEIAWMTALLLVCDPSLLFIARHDWGSFALGLACRCGALFLLASGWSDRGLARLFGAGLLLGLGVYNKIDFGIFLLGAGLAALVCARGWRAAGEGGLPSRAAAVLSGAALGATPVIAGAGGVLATARSAVRRQAQVDGDWSEKLHTLLATLDGSYFHELMLSGGGFDRMFATGDAPGGLLALAFAVASAGLAVWLWNERRSGRARPAETFALVAAWAVAIGIFLTPRAVRVHHALNLHPLPHLVVAIAIVRVATPRGADDPLAVLRRGVALIALVAIVAFDLVVVRETAAAISRSGGKGRWSDAIGALAVELEKRPGAVAVPRRRPRRAHAAPRPRGRRGLPLGARRRAASADLS